MRPMHSLVVFAGILAASFALPGQTPNVSKVSDDTELRAVLKQLITELASLRSELKQQRLDRQQTIISNLENDIRQVQLERVNLEEQERTQGSEIAELDERLQQANIDPTERASLEAVKAKVMIAVPKRFQAEKAIILSRERELQARLLNEQRLRQALLNENKSEGR